MCGITGFIGNSNFISKEELIGMTDVISRRGPDAAGYFYQNSIALGHRRLSIIDLSDSANQPMESSCGKFVMVYNGEVYNFKEIALEIISAKPDFKFKTSSDSEVILEAYVLWGAKFVSKLNGMFAISIYEKETKKLFICRDRLGIKPIYYFFSQGNFIFSSELKSIANYKNKLQLTVNKIAINEFLHLGYVPSPHSIYNEVKKFPTGNYAIVENGKLEFFTYWDLRQKIKKEIIYNEGEAKQRLKELLISSVKYRMISDVPFGTFLSGGIDSSLVTAIAQSVSNEPVNTFSIGFETEKNEAGYAKKVANHLRTNHHELYVTESDAINLIPDLVDLYDEPFADGSAVATQLVAKMARQNVTMTLSGDGGDELFMGYGAYNWATRLNDPTWFLSKGIISKVLMYGNSRQKRVADVLQRVSARHLKSHIFSQEHYFFSR
ncbi:MAG: asparagine synthase (glutamine-hydrolyzing), partial [Bacteroidota bacterium]